VRGCCRFEEKEKTGQCSNKYFQRGNVCWPNERAKRLRDSAVCAGRKKTEKEFERKKIRGMKMTDRRKERKRGKYK